MIRFNEKTRHLGYFENEIDAAIAYDKKAAELFGEFACLNFKYRIPKIAKGIDLSEIPAGTEYKEGGIMVFFGPGANGKAPKKPKRHEILQRGGNVVEKRHYKIVPGLSLVKLPAGFTVEQALKRFNNMSGVVYASPNYMVRATSNFPNDPYISDDPNDPDNLLWGMHNIGQTGGMAPIYAVRTGATGDISLGKDQTSNENIAWNIKRGGNYMTTPIVYKDLLYCCANNGKLTCFEAKTGSMVYQQKLQPPGSKMSSAFSASSIAAADKIYFT